MDNKNTAIINTILQAARHEEKFGVDAQGKPTYQAFPSPTDTGKNGLVKKISAALAEEGASGIEDLSNLIVKQIAEEIVKPVYEGFARKMFRPSTQLIGQPGLTIRFPKKDKTIAARVEELGEVLIGQGKLDGVDAETFLVAARAVWGYSAIEAGLVDHIADEIIDARGALLQFEVNQVVAAIAAGFDAANTVAAATSGTLVWGDLVNGRAYVRDDGFRADMFGVHPDQMANILNDAKMIDIRLIARMEPGGDSMFVIPKLGTTIIESSEFTTGTAWVWDSRKAGRLAIKTPVNVVKYDGAPVGVLEKGIIAWEMIDAKVVEGKGICQITGC